MIIINNEDPCHNKKAHHCTLLLLVLDSLHGIGSLLNVPTDCVERALEHCAVCGDNVHANQVCEIKVVHKILALVQFYELFR